MKKSISSFLLLAALLGTPQDVRAASGETIFGLTTDNKLITFNIESPTIIEDSVSISGLQGGETGLGIDIRPTTNELFLLGSTGRLYTLNVDTGVATQVGSPLTLTGASYGVDFNPTVDRLRVVSDVDENLRVNPDTAATTIDTNLAFDAGDTNNGADPQVTAVAYTANSVGETVTTLFGIDTALNVLVRQGSPNASPTSPNTGTLFTIGSLGVDPGSQAGFDIAEANSGKAVAALTLAGESTSKLYSIELGGGHASLIGAIGGTAAVTDIAVSRAGSVRFDQATYSVEETGANLTVFVERIGGSANPTSSGTSIPVTVNVVTSNGTAVAGFDYTAVSQAVTFNDGEIIKSLVIPILDDTAFEGSEAFNLTLASPTGGLLVDGTGISVATIINNDLPGDTTAPSITIDADRTIRESDFIRKGLAVDIYCSEDCSITAAIIISQGNVNRFKLSSTTLASTTTTRSAGEEKTSRVKPSSSVARKLQSKSGTLPGVLTVTATDSSGNVTTKTLKVLIK